MGDRRWSWECLAALVAGAVVVAACTSSDEPDRGDDRPSSESESESEQPAPVSATTPSRLRVVGGPPPGPPLPADTSSPEIPAYQAAALGSDEVVVGTWRSLRLGEWYVGSLSDGSWNEIDPPPVDGEVEASLHTVGHDAVLVAKLCPDGENIDSEGFPACARGSDGVGVWRLDHRDRTWSQVTMVPSDRLAPDDPDGDWSAWALGVVDEAVYVDVLSSDHRTVHRITMTGDTTVAFEWDDWVERDTNIHTRCVTGSGTLVGEVRTSGDMGSGGQMVGAGSSILALRDPGAANWRFLDDVTLTHLQPIVCGADTVSIVGETDASLDVGEWRVVDLDGEIVSTEPLPVAVLLGDSAEYTIASFFRSDNTHVAGGASEAPAVVRDFGDIVNPAVDGGTDPATLDHPRQVAVLPGPGLAPLAQSYPDDRVVEVHGATRLLDGRIAVITTIEGGHDRFQVLLAE